MSKDFSYLLTNFDGRKRALQKITRYSLYPVMFYRTNLWNHSRRVSWMVQELTPYVHAEFGQAFDSDKAEIMALVHDDAEMVTGDVQAGNKSKMNSKQLADVDDAERKAIDTLASRYDKHVGDYEYKTLLIEILERETLEAQTVVLADKLDAFGETLHEIYGGNTYFVTNVVNEYGTIPTPYEFYISTFNKFTEKYPRLSSLFARDAWFFHMPEMLDFKKICAESSLHTKTSLHEKTGYPHYDEWMQIQINKSSPNELAELYKATEPSNRGSSR